MTELALDSPRCGKGWGQRCAHAKSARCRCACGGANHGNPAARKDADDVNTKLTNPKIFERQWDEEKGAYIPSNHFIPGADEVADIVCDRDRGAIHHIDGDYRNNDIENLRHVAPNPREGTAKVNIRRQFIYHSPTGFEWGYGGSGPADLALNILGMFVPPPEAWRLHQDYKRDVVAGIPDEGMTITAESVRTWLQDRWAAETLVQNTAEAKE